MIRKINHIGIAVESIEAARPLYEQTLGLTYSGIEEVPDQKVRVAFFACGQVRIELLEPTAPDSPVARALQERGPGVHHIAYDTDDIVRELARAKERGVRLIDAVPRRGAHGTLIAFLHPKDTGKVLTELTQTDPAAPALIPTGDTSS
jgi:methylmalonyl-CoA/ethylmalonyl-CoA epimerase